MNKFQLNVLMKNENTNKVISLPFNQRDVTNFAEVGN